MLVDCFSLNAITYIHNLHPFVVRRCCDDEFRVVAIITKRNYFDNENYRAMTTAAVGQKVYLKPHTFKKSLKL